MLSENRIEQVSESLRDPNQTISFNGDVALLVIDVQREFCDPKGSRGNAQTKEVSQRIKSLVPEFRRAGIPVYAVYFSYTPKAKAADVDFYEFNPEPEDTLVAKNQDSAFAGSNIKELLRAKKHRPLLACGFNTSACVLGTVLDARKNGFDVSLLEDMTGNDNLNPRDPSTAISDMRREGVALTTSSAVLERVRAANVSRNAAAPA